MWPCQKEWLLRQECFSLSPCETIKAWPSWKGRILIRAGQSYAGEVTKDFVHALRA